MKKLINIVFVIYIIALFKITVFRDGFEIAGTFNYGKVNFIPFTDLFRIAAEDLKYFIYLFVGNIVWFAPIGFYMFGFRKASLVKTLVTGFIVSAVIETMQFVFGVGVCEIDDLILNTLGVYIGILSYKVVNLIRRQALFIIRYYGIIIKEFRRK